MDKLNITSTWKQMIESILEAEPQLSPGDLNFKEDNEEGLVKKLAEKLGRSEEQIIGWIESVSSTSTKAS